MRALERAALDDPGRVAAFLDVDAVGQVELIGQLLQLVLPTGDDDQVVVAVALADGASRWRLMIETDANLLGSKARKVVPDGTK